MALKKGVDVKPATGKLGILLPGMGAVATTFIAGVHGDPQGPRQADRLADPDGHIRLGKRTDDNSPAIKDYVPLAKLDDIVFGGWDIFPDNAYEAAARAGVLDDQAPRADQGRARGDQADAGRVRAGVRQEAQRAQRQDGHDEDGPRRAADRGHPALQGRRTAAIASSPCGAARPRSTASRPTSTRSLAKFEAGLTRDARRHRAVADLRVRVPQAGRPVRERRAEPVGRHAGAARAGAQAERADRRQGLQDRPDADEDDPRARLQGAHARPRGLVLDEHPRQPRRRGARRSRVVQDQGSLQARRARPHPPAARSTRTSTATSATSSASTTTRRAATTRRAGTTSTSSVGSATRCRSRSTSSAATRSSPRRSCSTSRCSSTSRSARA